VRLAVCGLPASLSVTVRVAASLEATEGENVTLIVQLAPAAKLAPQLFVWPKLLLLVPVIAILDIVTVDPPEFESVAAWGELVVPTC